MARVSALLCATAFVAVVRGQQCTSSDWLVCPIKTPVTATNWTLGALSGVTVGNGLVSRSFVTVASGAPLFATWDYVSFLDVSAGLSLVRSLSPEATITLQNPGDHAPVVVSLGGATVAGHSGSESWQLAGHNQATECNFVSQGPTISLAACQAACWASSACTIVNWIAAASPADADCVLKSCSPGQFALTPYPGCDAWTLVNSTAGPVRSVTSGPYLNRTGLDSPGTLIPMPSPLDFVGYCESVAIATSA